MLTRREFHHRTLSAVAVGLTASATFGFRRRAAAADEPPSAKKKYPSGTFFDFHVHIGRATNHVPPLSVEELLRWMDAHDVAQAAVLPLASPEAASYLITSDFVLAESKPHRDRLVPFCSIDPRTDYSGGPRGLLDMLRRYVDAGARGFGEHKAGLAIDDPRNMRLYAACAELKLPVLIHIDATRNTDKPGLPGLAKVLAEFPGTNFLGHAFGWWASIDGAASDVEFAKGPRQGPVAPGGAIDALMDKYSNLYGDLSATSGAAAIRRDPKFGREFLMRRADRLVFGSDFHSPNQQIPQFDLYRELNLPADVQAKIFRDNARRLVGV